MIKVRYRFACQCLSKYSGKRTILTDTDKVKCTRSNVPKKKPSYTLLSPPLSSSMTSSNVLEIAFPVRSKFTISLKI